MTKKTVVLLIAHEGYHQIEYGVTREILASDSNLTVLTASDEAGVAIAKDSSSTTVDLTIEQINPTTIDGLFLIGGPGAMTCLDKPEVYTLLQQMMALKKPYGAICISPRILAKANVLGGKKATGWDDDNKLEDIFKSYAVVKVDQPVVTDGNVVTATGPDAAQGFAQAILRVLGEILPF